MIKSITAVLSGIIFIIIAMLTMQLIFIIISVAYYNISKDNLFLKEIEVVLKYIFVVPVSLVIMFLGGYITATIAKNKALIHCLIVGFTVIGGMMGAALVNAELTLSGGIVSVVAVLVIAFGGNYAGKDDVKKSTKTSLS